MNEWGGTNKRDQEETKKKSLCGDATTNKQSFFFAALKRMLLFNQICSNNIWEHSMRDRERRYEDDQRKRGQKTDRRWQNHNFKENVMLFFFCKTSFKSY